MFKTLLACGSSMAAIMTVGLCAAPAFATEIPTATAAPAPANATASANTTAADRAAGDNQTEVEAVVVTGTFIAGTPEDAAVPVEAVTLQELRNQGSPSNIDLVKGLSEIGAVAGEANRNNAFSIGAASINLRALSSSRTVVVFNGRRFPEQYSASVGRFNNIAIIPNAAIGRVEVLKDGGATTYGADAVGGVVNYITRRNLDGLEVNANYRWIRGGEGDWDGSISGGRVFDNFNILGVVAYTHRSELDLGERADDWALAPYLVGPSSWNGQGNPGSFLLQTQSAANTFSTITAPAGTLAAGQARPQISGTGILRDPGCLALGGYAGYSATPSPLCYFQFGVGQNLVEEQDTWQGYFEANYEVNRWFRAHGEFMLYQLDIPEIPIDNGGALVGNFPIAQVLSSGVLVPSPTGAQQVCGASACYTTPVSNPAALDMLGRIRNSDGTPALSAAQLTALGTGTGFGVGRIGLVTGTWRPFAQGGNPAPDLDTQHNYSTTLRYSLELSGDIPEFLGTNLRWTGAFTLNTLDYTIASHDILVDRLQAALNGLGGPGCTGTTPGANGCQYFNPFSNGVASSVYNGQVNTATFVGTGSFTGYTPGQGLQNNAALVRWLYVPIGLRRTSQYAIVDALISGETGIHLWADDPISIAVGGQYRRFHERTDLTDFADRTVNPCSTVGVLTCAARGGPLVFNRGIQLTGLTLDDDRTYPIGSGFFEIRAPITDSFVVDVSGRYEKFFSDVTDHNNDVFVSQATARWQVTSWLTLRGTAGQSFSQVNPPPLGCQGQTPPASGSGCPTATANTAAPVQYGSTAVLFTLNNYPNLAVEPEKGFNYNVGAIVNVGNFNATVDYYHIRIDDIIRALASANIITAIVQPGETGATALINCSSALITEQQALLNNRPFASLNGPCVQGSSRLNSTGAGGIGGLAANGASVQVFGAQGTQPALFNGGWLETSGIDFSATYRDDLWDGQLTVSVDGTWTLTYRGSDFVVGGVVVAAGFNGVGHYNSANAGGNGQRVPEFRGSLSFNYSLGRHNFNWTTRMTSSLINDDNPGVFTANNLTNANVGDAAGIAQCQALASTVSPPATTGAGTALYGAFCAQQNILDIAGRKVPTQFNSDFTYRVNLPWETSLTVTVQNVFDTDPPFSRDILNYDAFFGSPLGRTIRIGVLKTF